MRRFSIIAALLIAGCQPAPPKPFKPAPLPPKPLPKVEQTVDATELEKIIRGEVAPPMKGNFGYQPDAKATEEFLNTLPARTLFEANPELRPKGARPDDEANRDGIIALRPVAYQEPAPKKPTLLYRALYKVSPGWRSPAQGIGDCVSFGWAHAADVSLAVDKVTGKVSEWRPAATEAIYGGSRVEARGRTTGGYSDGSYGGAAAKWCKEWGVVWRQAYTDPAIDLTTYSSSRAKSWGNFGCGGQGDEGKLDAQAKKFPATQVALVRTFAEAAAAIESGYPVPVCSGQGFSSKRDEQGFSAASGSWAHCMCFTGVRYNPDGLLCQNSWGTTWVSGPVWPEDQPGGSFWVKAATAERMLSGGDSFAVSHIKGFPKRQLNHGEGW